MKLVLNKWPWTIITLFVQIIGGFLFFILVYKADFGLDIGSSLNSTTQNTYWILGITGGLGVIVTFIGMTIILFYENLWKAVLKSLFIYIPCMFLSVFWLYSYFFLKGII